MYFHYTKKHLPVCNDILQTQQNKIIEIIKIPKIYFRG